MTMTHYSFCLCILRARLPAMCTRCRLRFSIIAHALVGWVAAATPACGPMPSSMGPLQNGASAPAETGPGSWHFRLVGTGFRQVVEDRITGRVYGLRIAGGIDIANPGGWLNWDPGSGTRAIAADAGTCYVLKDNGNVWRREEAGGPWERIDDGTGTKQLLAASRRVYVLKQNGHVFAFSGNGWSQIDDGQQTR